MKKRARISELKKTISILEDLSLGLSIIIFTNTVVAGCHIKIIHKGKDVTDDIFRRIEEKGRDKFPILSKGHISKRTGALVIKTLESAEKEWVGLEFAHLFNSSPLFYQRGREDKITKNWRTVGLDTRTVWMSSKTPSQTYDEIIKITNLDYINNLKNRLD